MKVFIEQACEARKKNIFDKTTKTLTETVDFHITYPYPYGYLLDTKAADGDELDCYVITKTKLQTASIVECDVIGMVEYVEDGMPDHKILVTLKGQRATVDDLVKQALLDFDANFFINQPKKETQVGDFLGAADALAAIKQSTV